MNIFRCYTTLFYFEIFTHVCIRLIFIVYIKTHIDILYMLSIIQYIRYETEVSCETRSRVIDIYVCCHHTRL